MLIGYARVRKFEQNLDLQTDALKDLGIEKKFVDKVSGVKSEKPKLNELLKFVRKGNLSIKINTKLEIMQKLGF